jgi:hypothetical protein
MKQLRDSQHSLITTRKQSISNPVLLPGLKKVNYNDSTGDETSQEKRDEQSSLLFPEQMAKSSFSKRKPFEE